METVIWARREKSGRGPKPTYGWNDIAAAGIRLADAEGLDAVTMRRIAAELGTGTTTLYRHLTGKEDIFDLMTDAAFGEQAPPPLTGDWRADLTALAHHTRARMLRHPWLGTLSAMRPSLGPNSLEWQEFTLATVDGHGLTPDEMLIATGIVTMFVLGTVMTELAERGAGASRAQWMAAQGSWGDAIATGDRFPVLARIMVEAELPHRPDLTELAFAQGLDRILAGLALRINP